MAKKFTKEDLQKIKEQLQVTCEISWKKNGYKRTNIPYLTKEVGISTGAFYLVYQTKEELFLEVLENVQNKLLSTWASCIEEEKSSLLGFKKGMMWVYEEYQTYPMLYGFNHSEYDLFFAKLPQEEVNRLKEKSMAVFSEVLTHATLQLRIPEDEAINILHTILFISTIERDSLTTTKATFEFLLDHSLPGIFEEATNETI